MTKNKSERNLTKEEILSILSISINHGILPTMVFGPSGNGKSTILAKALAKKENLLFHMVSVANITLVDAFGRENNPVPNKELFPTVDSPLIRKMKDGGFNGILFVLDDVLKQIDPEIQKGVVNPLLYERVIRNMPLHNKVKIISTSNLGKGQDAFKMDIAQTTRNSYIPWQGDEAVVEFFSSKGLMPNNAIKSLFTRHINKVNNESTIINDSWGKLIKMTRGLPSSNRQWEDMFSKLPSLLELYFKKELSENALMIAIKGSLSGLGNEIDVILINEIISEYKQAEKLIEYDELIKISPEDIDKKKWSMSEKLAVARVYFELIKNDSPTKKQAIKNFLINPINEMMDIAPSLVGVVKTTILDQKMVDNLIEKYSINPNEDIKYSEKGFDKKWYEEQSVTDKYAFDSSTEPVIKALEKISNLEYAKELANK